MDKGEVYRLVGERIRTKRKAKKLTQDQLANALNLTRTSITNIEKGRQTILLHSLYTIGEVLGCDPRELLSPPETIQLPPIIGTADAPLMARLPDLIHEVVNGADNRRKGVRNETD